MSERAILEVTDNEMKISGVGLIRKDFFEVNDRALCLSFILFGPPVKFLMQPARKKAIRIFCVPGIHCQDRMRMWDHIGLNMDLFGE
jgi:hypothetical protein